MSLTSANSNHPTLPDCKPHHKIKSELYLAPSLQLQITMKLVITGCRQTCRKISVGTRKHRHGPRLQCVDNDLPQTGNDCPGYCPGYSFVEADPRDLHDAVVNLAAHRNPGDYKAATYNTSVHLYFFISEQY